MNFSDHSYEILDNYQQQGIWPIADSSLLSDKYNNRSVLLLNDDLLSSISLRIFSEFLLPPGSLICKKFFFFFIR